MAFYNSKEYIGSDNDRGDNAMFPGDLDWSAACTNTEVGITTHARGRLGVRARVVARVVLCASRRRRPRVAREAARLSPPRGCPCSSRDGAEGARRRRIVETGNGAPFARYHSLGHYIILHYITLLTRRDATPRCRNAAPPRDLPVL